MRFKMKDSHVACEISARVAAARKRKRDAPYNVPFPIQISREQLRQIKDKHGIKDAHLIGCNPGTIDEDELRRKVMQALLS